MYVLFCILYLLGAENNWQAQLRATQSDFPVVKVIFVLNTLELVYGSISFSTYDSKFPES